MSIVAPPEFDEPLNVTVVPSVSVTSVPYCFTTGTLPPSVNFSKSVFNSASLLTLAVVPRSLYGVVYCSRISGISVAVTVVVPLFAAGSDPRIVTANFTIGITAASGYTPTSPGSCGGFQVERVPSALLIASFSAQVTPAVEFWPNSPAAPPPASAAIAVVAALRFALL